MYIRVLIFIAIILIGCGSVRKIDSGAEAYNYKKYALAIDLLEEELKDREDYSGRLLLARSYDALGHYESANEQYDIIIDDTEDTNVWFEYAKVLKKAHRYDKAIQILKILKTESQLDYQVDREIRSSELSQRWLNTERPLVEISNLDLNTAYSEYAAEWIDGQVIFTSDRLDEDEDIYDWTGVGYSDLWVGSNEGAYTQMWSSGFNTKNNEGVARLYPNGKELYFTRCSEEGGGDVNCHIFRSVRAEVGAWGKPELVEELNGLYNSRHPAFSKDGQLMFYSSDRNDAFGGYDIYFSQRNENSWSPGKPLPQSINSEGNEVFPFVRLDTLFFSSDGHMGMGGLDIFKSYFGNNDQWIKPINLETPFNSGGDDFAIWFDTLRVKEGIQAKGFISSNRMGGKGRDDIYSFEIKEEEVKEVEKDPQDYVLSLKVLEPVYVIKGDPKSGLEKYRPSNNSIINLDTGSVKLDLTGLYSSVVDSSYISTWIVQKDGYFPRSISIDMKDAGESQQLFIKVKLEPIIYNKDYTLNNIYYDFEKWDIREDARPSLDSLITILQFSPNVKIQLSSHTDCRGDDQFNLDLSRKRAESAVAYLKTMGIDSKRLIPIGRGEEEPAVDCICADCSEVDHQSNRRTTFRLLR